jgi:competence ComEA-like helix-hairpin-helix protein
VVPAIFDAELGTQFRGNVVFLENPEKIGRKKTTATEEVTLKGRHAMFYLTPQERNVVIAVVTVFIIGVTVQWFLHRGARPLRWVKSAHSIKININTAGTQRLQMLPGIGPTLAAKIISYRKENGGFAAIEDLRKVNGITDKRLSKMRDLIEL